MKPVKNNPALPDDTSAPDNEPPMQIIKPSGFSLDKFRSTQSATVAGVETLLGGLPHHGLAEAKDFARLHPDDNEDGGYWSVELCFVNVPIKGQKDTKHLITEKLALRYLPSATILHFRLALATKPYDKFFLCYVPWRNVENNAWNKSNKEGCLIAKTRWVRLTSRRPEGAEGYKVEFTRDKDPFPEPTWPTQTLPELIDATFKGCQIETEDHPSLRRLIGAKQSMS